MSKWQERLARNVQKLQSAALELEKSPTADNINAKTILSAQRCQSCGEMLVTLFAGRGPYICGECLKEVKEKIAEGAQLFCELPKKYIDG